MAKLSDNDIQEIQEVIGIFDRVGDGKVDVNHIVNILRSLGMLSNCYRTVMHTRCPKK